MCEVSLSEINSLLLFHYCFGYHVVVLNHNNKIQATPRQEKQTIFYCTHTHTHTVAITGLSIFLCHVKIGEIFFRRVSRHKEA